MTSNLLRKLMVASAVVAALGVVACKPKPAADASAAASSAAAFVPVYDCLWGDDRL